MLIVDLAYLLQLKELLVRFDPFPSTVKLLVRSRQRVEQRLFLRDLRGQCGVLAVNFGLLRSRRQSHLELEIDTDFLHCIVISR